MFLRKIKFQHKILLIVTFFLVIVNVSAQKPRKIYKYIQENQLNLAVDEYNKMAWDKEYDNDEKVLFSYAKCIFQIDTNYQYYNPIQAIKEFNVIYGTSESIYKFLRKYNLSPEIISEKIHQEIYFQAKRINTVDSYKKALKVCSNSYISELTNLLEISTYKLVKSNKDISQLENFLKTYHSSVYKNEVQDLLEREILDSYKQKGNFDSLNLFISKYESSKYIAEAIDLRDSLILIKGNVNKILIKDNDLEELVSDRPENIYLINNNLIFRSDFINNMNKSKILGFIDIQNHKYFKINKADSVLKFLGNGLADVLFNGKHGVKNLIKNQIILPNIYDGIEYINDSLVRVYNYDVNTLYSSKIINVKTTKIIYDSIDFRYKEYFVIKKNNKVGLLNLNTLKITIDCVYDYIEDYDDSLVKVVFNRKIGILNKYTGKILIPVEFENAYHIDNNTFIVKNNNKYGLFSKKSNNIVLETVYDNIETLSDNFLLVQKNNKEGILNRKNFKLIVPTIYEIDYFEHILDFGDSKSNYFITVYNNYNYGVFNIYSNKLIIPTIYTSIYKTEATNSIILAHMSNKSRLIDLKNNQILFESNNSIISFFGKERIVRIEQYENLKLKSCCLINVDSKKKILEINDGYVNKFADYSFFSFKKDKKLYVIDLTGKLILETTCTHNEENDCSSACGCCCCINVVDKDFFLTDEFYLNTTNGQKYYENFHIISGSLAIQNKNNKEGLINLKNGKVIIPAIYDNISKIDDSIAIIYKDGRIGSINLTNGKIITPIIYEATNNTHYSEYCCITSIDKDNKRDSIGMINLKTNQIIIPFKYEFIFVQENKVFAIVMQNNKIGVLNIKTVNYSTPLIYDNIFAMQNNEINFLNIESGNYSTPLLNRGNYVPNYCVDSLIIIKYEGLNGILNTKTNKFILVNDTIVEIRRFGAIIKRYGKLGVINLNTGEIIVPVIYDRIQTIQYHQKKHPDELNVNECVLVTKKQSDYILLFSDLSYHGMW